MAGAYNLGRMSEPPFRLDGKTAVVTGGSQGIGRAACLALARAGASVAVTNIPQKRGDVDLLVAQIEGEGGVARGYDLDVAQTDALGSAMDAIVEDMGSLDVLVNNAGIRAGAPALEVTEQLWDAVHAVNLKGTFFAAQAAARHMLAGGYGRIINVASQLAVTATVNRSVYISTKGAVAALTRALALEWADRGVTVNAVGPGPTDTPMTQEGDPNRDIGAFLRRSPLGRRLEPEEIAGAVVFLSSAEAGAVNGHLLLVDAGWSVS